MAIVTPATVVGLRVRSAAIKGNAMKKMPSPRLEIVDAAKRRWNLWPSDEP